VIGSGSGRTAGEAIVAAAKDLGTRKGQARGWHARLRLLTRTGPGYAALRAAGLDVTARTLVAWLAEDREPSKANQAKIGKGWGLYQVGRFAGGQGSISGEVRFGHDLRDRGNGVHAPFRVNHRRGDYQRLGPELSKTNPNPALVEMLYIVDVIYNDLGEPSDGMEFPGSQYTMEIN
jgi:hypothetical protein